MAEQIIPLVFPPGVERDGTRVDSSAALDALWCRWRKGRPRKMGGFSEVYDALNGPSRKIHAFYTGSNIIVHVGTSVGIEQIIMDRNGNFISWADRTPPSGFTGGPNVGWTLDSIFDTIGGLTQLIANAVPDRGSAASTTATNIFSGQIDSPNPLTVMTGSGSYDGGTYTQPMVAGGIVCIQPYLFDYSTAGLIQWSPPNKPGNLGVVGGTSGAGQARVSAQKIVAGRPLKGGGVNSPAAVFWSLSEVITAQFVGSSAGFFAFNTVSPSTSILAPDIVVEYDGLYYWAGIDRFQVFNGTVEEVPNRYNQDWFFDNMNWDYAAKSYAFKVPRWGEIWFCAPLFGATEPSHAVIYNRRENCWYDTALPNSGRSAAVYAPGTRFPLMGGTSKGSRGYSLWAHEYGVDQRARSGVPSAVRSYFETPFIGGYMSNPPTSDAASFQVLEPDTVQSGDLSVYVTGGYTPHSAEYAEPATTVKGTPTVEQDEIATFKTERRLGRLHVESNELGGNYICGRSLLHIGKGGGRILGKPGTALTAQP